MPYASASTTDPDTLRLDSTEKPVAGYAIGLRIRPEVAAESLAAWAQHTLSQYRASRVGSQRS
eukprot:3519192-Rhodomonas_salina.1